ncbi:hypothetical protein [Roseivivax sp. CAU 1753]
MAHTLADHRPDLFTCVSDAMEGALRFMSRNNPRFQQLTMLRAMNDADLAARGETRAQAVRRTFRNRFYL